MVKAMFYV